jgi:hypothetical protein
MIQVAATEGLGMTRNTRIVAIAAIPAILIIVLIWLGSQYCLFSARIAHCSDGEHPTVCMRDFTTQYWAYSIKLKATLKNKSEASSELSPETLSSLSEALQDANEFRKYVVAGYNSCAITPAQYSGLGDRAHRLDGLAREINALLAKPALSEDEGKALITLIKQYSDLVRQPVAQSEVHK